MRRWLYGLAVVAVCSMALAFGQTLAQDKKPVEPPRSDVWMKKKLEFSQEILAGLTAGDFDRVNTNAQMLGFVGYLSAWLRADEEAYKRQITYFEFATKELGRQAKEKNMDGATLAYNQLTTSCVQCHKVVREPKR